MLLDMNMAAICELCEDLRASIGAELIHSKAKQSTYNHSLVTFYFCFAVKTRGNTLFFIHVSL